jgi:hypothetical protein
MPPYPFHPSVIRLLYCFSYERDYKTVWEYINPYYYAALGGILNMVYRAYRIPYDWIPQVPVVKEESIQGPDIRTFRVPGSRDIE